MIWNHWFHSVFWSSWPWLFIITALVYLGTLHPNSLNSYNSPRRAGLLRRVTVQCIVQTSLVILYYHPFTCIVVVNPQSIWSNYSQATSPVYWLYNQTNRTVVELSRRSQVGSFISWRMPLDNAYRRYIWRSCGMNRMRKFLSVNRELGFISLVIVGTIIFTNLDIELCIEIWLWPRFRWPIGCWNACVRCWPVDLCFAFCAPSYEPYLGTCGRYLIARERFDCMRYWRQEECSFRARIDNGARWLDQILTIVSRREVRISYYASFPGIVIVFHTPTLPSTLVPPAAAAVEPDATSVLFAPDVLALTALLATRLPFPLVAGAAFPFSLVLDASESSGCTAWGAFFMMEEVDERFDELNGIRE